MRLAPIPMFFYPDAEQAMLYAGESSRTTHGAQECIDACRILAWMLVKALDGKVKDPSSPSTLCRKSEFLFGTNDLVLIQELEPNIRAIAAGEYRDKTEAQIKGSGYVVDSLEAALWCFYKTDSFRDAILKAFNLGDDTDTTAAVCGQIAGAYYGEAGIPAEWLIKLYLRDKITEFADKLYRK